MYETSKSIWDWKGWVLLLIECVDTGLSNVIPCNSHQAESVAWYDALLSSELSVETIKEEAWNSRWRLRYAQALEIDVSPLDEVNTYLLCEEMCVPGTCKSAFYTNIGLW